MNSTMVRTIVDFSQPRILTEAQEAELAALAKRSDDEIDFSDIPELTEDFWKNAVRNPFCKPIKQQTTVRIDRDVMHWLKSQGKGYQTRMNQILREAMLKELLEELQQKSG